MRFNLPHLDQTSFWIGFVAASVFWILFSCTRPLFKQIFQIISDNRNILKSRKGSLIEEHYLANALRQAQRMHLASNLFSLEEIFIEPKLLAPPPRVSPDEIPFTEDLVTELVPYLPSWPEMAATFRAPTLSLFQALSGSSDIVLTGQPGSGKTFALAYLASRIAEHSIEPGFPENRLPFSMHLADLNLPLKNEEDPINRIIDFVSSYSSPSDLPRIPQFVKEAFIEGRALLLLDGTDEVAPENLPSMINFIKSVKQNYSQTQIITTGILENLSGLVTLNFIPFTLACWDSSDYESFLSKWGQLWTQYVVTETWSQSGAPQIDSILLNSWISSINSTLSPFELTLLAWGTYAGDIHSGTILDTIKAHIHRLKPTETPEEALEMLALQAFTSTDMAFDPRKAREWIKSFEPVEIPVSEEEKDHLTNLNVLKKSLIKKKGDALPAPSLGLISKFVATGLLVIHRNNRMNFVHPIIGGYLAGKVLGNLQPENILSLPNSSGKYLAMNYFAALDDAEKLASKLMTVPDRPLHRNELIVARWLRDAKNESKWRLKIMEILVGLLRTAGQSLGLRGQVLAAIIKSGDPGVPKLFRQMMESDDPELLQLCVLGSASIKDTKAIEDIARLLNHINPNVRRTACLGLVTIGTQSALDHVAYLLLHGDEDSRRAAAEALANHPEEGYAMLREGSSMEDILVRRAVAYGLGRIYQFWATEILTKLQLEDEQWIVRDAATEVLDKKLQINRYIPKRLPPPSECPWLIAFAGKKGVGISPNSPATEMLLMVLAEGTEVEQLAALDYLRAFSSVDVFASFYKIMDGGNIILREAIFRAIWEMASKGVVIPDPQQFGVS
ncbi:MAG: hypothetical protein A2X25_11100 [Chloroflexi bacterium GWB2_49_20]|nr:MAG: hypothetical protein A2X25_11100 [Chloroflexi bacterium GWB2_49_20]OGN78900.1 MAG: hypothetical protein A2X26_00255 [Chloroflexi bacterium GWC2_49_37]OGN86339.1 MAG: hypothetical protein A2X27_05525 [Chloroflexi bacterium GWD2_49_16]HBG74571.1 hypothetical protein [Anaerolineae bacterium]